MVGSRVALAQGCRNGGSFPVVPILTPVLPVQPLAKHGFLTPMPLGAGHAQPRLVIAAMSRFCSCHDELHFFYIINRIHYTAVTTL
jgi:hypothetical protein